jgi:hypothetical protein
VISLFLKRKFSLLKSGETAWQADGGIEEKTLKQLLEEIKDLKKEIMIWRVTFAISLALGILLLIGLGVL